MAMFYPLREGWIDPFAGWLKLHCAFSVALISQSPYQRQEMAHFIKQQKTDYQCQLAVGLCAAGLHVFKKIISMKPLHHCCSMHWSSQEESLTSRSLMGFKLKSTRRRRKSLWSSLLSPSSRTEAQNLSSLNMQISLLLQHYSARQVYESFAELCPNGRHGNQGPCRFGTPH